MCCFISIILIFGSRIAIVFWWLVDPARFTAAVKSLPLPGILDLPTWVWSLLGLLFLPWTTLAYLFVFPGGISIIEWILLGAAFLVDLGGYTGGYRSRKKLYH
jgi:hypothetical protein